VTLEGAVEDESPCRRPPGETCFELDKPKVEHDLGATENAHFGGTTRRQRRLTNDVGW